MCVCVCVCVCSHSFQLSKITFFFYFNAVMYAPTWHERNSRAVTLQQSCVLRPISKKVDETKSTARRPLSVRALAKGTSTTLLSPLSNSLCRHDGMLLLLRRCHMPQPSCWIQARLTLMATELIILSVKCK